MESSKDVQSSQKSEQEKVDTYISNLIAQSSQTKQAASHKRNGMIIPKDGVKNFNEDEQIRTFFTICGNCDESVTTTLETEEKDHSEDESDNEANQWVLLFSRPYIFLYES